jgi:hypothetical protein
VYVNLGGEPDRDDYGLPPVDVEIPDDARELDRDVQAYHREQRALRRHLRRRRWAGPLGRDGMVLPLLAGCLVLALIAGTLLTVFTAVPEDLSITPRPHGAAGPPSTPLVTEASGNAAPATSVTAVTGPHHLLPARSIKITVGLLPLRKVNDSVLALVPRGCRCATAVRDLIAQAKQAGVRIYLVGTDGGMPGVRRLADAARPDEPVVADDVHDVLGTTYGAHGLTALLVDAHGGVQLATKLPPSPQLTSQLYNLSHAATPAP